MILVPQIRMRNLDSAGQILQQEEQYNNRLRNICECVRWSLHNKHEVKSNGEKKSFQHMQHTQMYKHI